jgi:hypothetical protein
MAKPLRIDRTIERLIKQAILAHAASAIGNLVLAAGNRSPKDWGALTLSPHEGACGPEFSHLAEDTGACYGRCIQRSAEYLNWRYLQCPLARFEIVTARRQGALVGYAIYTHTGDDATLADLFGINDPTIFTALVQYVVAVLRQRGVMTLSAPILESHPWVPLLRRLGFRPREASPVIIYAPRWPPPGGSGAGNGTWLLMRGDRDC